MLVCGLYVKVLCTHFINIYFRCYLYEHLFSLLAAKPCTTEKIRTFVHAIFVFLALKLTFLNVE